MSPQPVRVFVALLVLLGGLRTSALETSAAPTDAYLDQTRARWEQVSRQIW